MLVLGVHMGHDSAVAVVDDGRIVSLVERERHTRVKHAAIAEIGDIELALADAGCTLEDIDYVAVTATQNWPFVFYDKDRFRFDFALGRIEELQLEGVLEAPLQGAIERVRRGQSQATERIESFMNRAGASMNPMLARSIDLGSPTLEYRANREWLWYPKTWDDGWSLSGLRALDPTAIRNAFAGHDSRRTSHVPIEVTIGGRQIPGALIPHHLAHAASAFFQSDRDSAAIITYDGSWRREVFGQAGGLFCIGQGNRLQVLLPNFLTAGNMYSRMAHYLVLDRGHGGPGKLMGLAPYGRPRFFDPDLVGNLYDNPDLMTGRGLSGTPLANHYMTILHLIRRATEQGRALGYDAVIPTGDSKLSQFSKDLAASVQKTFEEQSLLAATTLFEMAAKLGRTETNLCLSGGCALNCPSNSRIWREGPFQNVFVPPTCDDSGLAIGSALYLTHAVFDRPRQPQGADTSTSAYLGRRHPQSAVDAALRNAGDRLRVTPVGDAAADAAAALADDKVVAWYEGRSEVGPRALGHRSILADPRAGANWQRVNRIKSREHWRPFAPAVLEEKAADWFDGAPLPSPFMLFTARVRSRQLPAITHVDGSARIQTVAPDCGGFRSLLEAFDRQTGVPVVLNTSFNGPGEPIVEAPQDAIDLFRRSELDHLYMDGHRFDRTDGEDGR